MSYRSPAAPRPSSSTPRPTPTSTLVGRGAAAFFRAARARSETLLPLLGRRRCQGRFSRRPVFRARAAAAGEAVSAALEIAGDGLADAARWVDGLGGYDRLVGRMLERGPDAGLGGRLWQARDVLSSAACSVHRWAIGVDADPEAEALEPGVLDGPARFVEDRSGIVVDTEKLR